MKLVKINKNGSMETKNIIVNLKHLCKQLNQQSEANNIQHLYTWKYDESDIYCYGSIEGNAGSENKHDLPPNGEKKISCLDNSDTQLLFNDIYIIKKGNRLCNFDIEDYDAFYSVCFGGFDTCDSEDHSEVEDEQSMNDGFIVNDTEDDDDSDYVMGSDDELETDTEDIIED